MWLHVRVAEILKTDSSAPRRAGEECMLLFAVEGAVHCGGSATISHFAGCDEVAGGNSGTTLPFTPVTS